MKDTTLQFAGGAGTVTGSKHLLRAEGRQILLDCGLFQGLKPLRLRNRAGPPFDPEAIDAVVLSHAHIDHSGYLPLLVRKGFDGPVHCTPGTQDLLRVMLLDSAHLQEEEAATANRHRYSKHHPALPLYTTEDAERAIALARPRPYGKDLEVASGIRVRFHRAGHILGAAIVEVVVRGSLRLVFSGDLGRYDRPILRDPDHVTEADVLLVESTYGDRDHPPGAAEELARVVCEAERRGGALIIPAFAVGRTQELLWNLRRLEQEERIPTLPVFLDSPMAIDVTEIYRRHPEDHDVDMRALVDSGTVPLRTRLFQLSRTVDDSKALNAQSGPFIVIAGSGMATGGRVIHHMKERLPDPATTILLSGYQAAGTRGRKLEEGAETVRIHGQDVVVRATIEKLDGLSAHADRSEILRWLGGFRRPPRKTWVVHGERAASDAMAAAIHERFGWSVEVAGDGETVRLDR